MINGKKKISFKLPDLVLHIDIFSLFGYIFFRNEVLTGLLDAFDSIAPDSVRYRFLIWTSFLFTACITCSIGRRLYYSLPVRTSKMALLFEIVVLSAVILAVWKSMARPAYIDPSWILNLSLLSYFLEVVTTAGAGYVLADLLFRVPSILKKS